jgi:hypothetical protein
MTPDEYRRLETIERRQAIAEERDRIADVRLDRMEGKIDKLVTAAAMGRGAFWLLTKLGGLIVLAMGAFAWAADHFRWFVK